ncbi:leucine-rich repeat protein [Perkinsela sp. CCAP 1560/4]|nr:leucine-rich repeat protein [Perkinsela sp. CCAP 1560/4]|eukprot:KNH04394.1 leucine-rich repeat protein [Perkinsela sp. CCAP 1560/4]
MLPISVHPFVVLLGDIPSIGRVDYASMSQQLLMELVVNEIGDKSPFLDENSNFHLLAEWPGVFLNDTGEVQAIDWCVGLTIDFGKHGTIHLHWLPATTSDVKISFGSLSGVLKTASLPQPIHTLVVTGNHLNGQFRIENLPRGMEEVGISSNRFIGTLNIPTLPRGIKKFAASNNAFSGTLNLTTLPPGIEELILSENKFVGSVALPVVPRTLRMICLEGNSLCQEELRIDLHPTISIITLRGNTIGKLVDPDGREIRSHLMVEY